MTALAMPAPNETRLPQLSGRWVLLYQLLWGALAITAIGVMAVAAYNMNSGTAVLSLRLIKGGVLITVCAILLRRRKTDPVAALLSLALLTWTITSSFDFASSDLLPMLADRLRFMLFALALLLFPNGSWQPSWTRGVAAASAAVFLLGVAEGLGITGTRLFLPLAILCVVAAVAALIARFRTADSEAVRQQLKWVALGLVSGVTLILTARAGAAISKTSPRLPDLPILWEGVFQLGIISVALGFLVSLLRYRLFDAETAISRSAALAVLTLALVATFAGTEAAIEWVGQQYFGMGIGNISAAMAAAIAAVLLSPLHERISGWAEHHFQRDLVALKRDLPELLAEFSDQATVRELGAAIVPRIAAAMHADRAALIVNHKVAFAQGFEIGRARSWLSESDLSEGRVVDDLFPVRLPLQGRFSTNALFLVLGPRPDGSLQAGDELEAISAIAPELRRSLCVALRRGEDRAVEARNRRRIAAQIATLTTRFAALERATLMVEAR